MPQPQQIVTSAEVYDVKTEMPAFQEFVKTLKASLPKSDLPPEKFFANTAFICVQHAMVSTAMMFEAFINDFGANPNNIFELGKIYSEWPVGVQRLKTLLGEHYFVHERTEETIVKTAFKEIFESAVKKMVNEFIQHVGNNSEITQVIIMDDGGKVIDAIFKDSCYDKGCLRFRNGRKVPVGAVEQTTAGTRDIVTNFVETTKKFKKLCSPVIMVSSSALKNKFEPRYIAEGVISSIVQLSDPNNPDELYAIFRQLFSTNLDEISAGVTIGIVGLGNIGKAIFQKIDQINERRARKFHGQEVELHTIVVCDASFGAIANFYENSDVVSSFTYKQGKVILSDDVPGLFAKADIVFESTGNDITGFKDDSTTGKIYEVLKTKKRDTHLVSCSSENKGFFSLLQRCFALNPSFVNAISAESTEVSMDYRLQDRYFKVGEKEQQKIIFHRDGYPINFMGPHYSVPFRKIQCIVSGLFGAAVQVQLLCNLMRQPGNVKLKGAGNLYVLHPYVQRLATSIWLTLQPVYKERADYINEAVFYLFNDDSRIKTCSRYEYQRGENIVVRYGDINENDERLFQRLTLQPLSEDVKVRRALCAINYWSRSQIDLFSAGITNFLPPNQLSTYVELNCVDNYNRTVNLGELSTFVNKELLENPTRRVCLIYAPAGAGKSTFCRMFANNLAKSFDVLAEDRDAENRRNPTKTAIVYISLARYPVGDVTSLAKFLISNVSLPREQVRHLQQTLIHDDSFKLIIILDGYDEWNDKDRSPYEIYTDLPEWGSTKIIITCRDAYMLRLKNRKDANIFVPPAAFKWGNKEASMREISIAAFSRTQLEEYLKHRFMGHDNVLGGYLDALTAVPRLYDLLSNPTILDMVSAANISIMELRQLTLTKACEFCMEKFLGQQAASNYAMQVGANEEMEVGEVSMTIKARILNFCEDFAMDLLIYGREDVQESQIEQLVKAHFGVGKNANLRNLFPIRKFERKLKVNQDLNTEFKNVECWEFISPLWKIYFAACIIVKQIVAECDNNTLQNTLQDLPNKINELRSLIQDLPISRNAERKKLSGWLLFCQAFADSSSDLFPLIDFFRDYVIRDGHFKNALWQLIRLSAVANNELITGAAANAITILNAAGVNFSGENLQGIRIPQADLSGAIMESVNLRDADLSGVRVPGIYLNRADLTGANLLGVNFGEYPSIEINQPGYIHACAYSSDKRFLAVACGDTIYIYDGDAKMPCFTIAGPGGIVTSLAFNTNNLLVFGGQDNHIYLWQMETVEVDANKVIFRQIPIMQGANPNPHQDHVEAVRFLDDYTVASASKDSTIAIWTIMKKSNFDYEVALNTLLRAHDKNNYVWDIDYSTKLSQLVSAGQDGWIYWWDREGNWEQCGKEDCRQYAQGNSWHKGVLCVKLADNGSVLASAHGNNSIMLHHWFKDEKKWQITHIFSGHAAITMCLAFAPGSGVLASGAKDKTIKLWNVENKMEIKTFFAHHGVIETIAFKNEDILVSGGEDKNVRAFSTKSVVALKPKFTGHFGYVWSMDVYHDKSTDDHWLASGGKDGTVNITRLYTGETLCSFPVGNGRAIRCLSFGKDGKLAISANFGAAIFVYYLYANQTGNVEAALARKIDLKPDVKAESLIFRSYQDNEQLFWGESDGGICCVDMSHLENVYREYYFADQCNSINHLSLDQSRRFLIVASVSGLIRIYDLQNMESWREICKFTEHGAQVNRIQCLNMGEEIDDLLKLRLISASHDQTIKIWQPGDNGSGVLCKSQLDSGYKGGILSLAIDSSRKYLASGGSNSDSSLKIWDLYSYKLLLNLKFLDSINSLIWQVEGERLLLLAGTFGGALRCWEAIFKDGKLVDLLLRWANQPPSLSLSQAKISNVKLNDSSRALMVQCGALSEETSSIKDAATSLSRTLPFSFLSDEFNRSPLEPMPITVEKVTGIIERWEAIVADERPNDIPGRVRRAGWVNFFIPELKADNETQNNFFAAVAAACEESNISKIRRIVSTHIVTYPTKYPFLFDELLGKSEDLNLLVEFLKNSDNRFEMGKLLVKAVANALNISVFVLNHIPPHIMNRISSATTTIYLGLNNDGKFYAINGVVPYDMESWVNNSPDRKMVS